MITDTKQWLRSWFDDSVPSSSYAFLDVAWLLCHVYVAVRLATMLAVEWHLPLVPYPYPLIATISETPKVVLAGLICMHAACIFCLSYDIERRIVRGVIAVIGTWVLLSSASFYANHLAFYAIACLIMAWTPERKAAMSAAPLRLLQIHLALLYAFSALHKSLIGWAYRWTHTDEALHFMQHELIESWWQTVSGTPIPYLATHWYVLLLALAAIGALRAHIEPAWAAIGVALHGLMLLFVPDVTVFGFALMTTTIWLSAALSSKRSRNVASFLQRWTILPRSR